MRKVLLLLLTPVIVALSPAIVGLLIYRRSTYKRYQGLQQVKVASKAPLELHYTPMSLCSSKALLCMHESGLNFRGVEVDIGHFGKFDQLTKAFLEMNPNACVPVLVDRGHPILESHDIIDYVCNELGAAHLKPANEDSTALESMQHWTERGSFIDMENHKAGQLGPAVAILSSPLFAIDEHYMRLGTLVRALPKHPQPKIILLKIANWFLGPNLPPRPMVESAFQDLEKGMADMARELADGREWLAGERYSLADITWTANFVRLELLGVLDHFIEKHASIQAYWQRLKNRPSYHAVFTAPLNKSEEMRCLSDVAQAARNRCIQKGVVNAYGL